MRLRLGISTCPNDTFAFHALLAGDVEIDGVELEVTLADVEELNEGFLAGRFDVCKVSTHAAFVASERAIALPSGWALGHGVGPVVLASRASRAPQAPNGVPRRPRVLCPGRWTTATLLWRLFHPEDVELEQVVFSDIMPALESGRADLGVCIHEGRFTWRERGLELVEDLGETWARETDAPLPLGGIVAHRDLDGDLARRVASGIRSSVEWGHAHRDACLATMRRYAQEETDAVLWAHVELYVNAWTLDLGPDGRSAFAVLSRLGRERGLLPASAALEALA